MKRTLSGLLCLIILVPVFASGGEVLVKVTDIGSEKGQVVIGLYKKGNFTETGGEFRGARVEGDTPALTYSFKDVPPGKYAISLFHDKNSNGKLDTNFMGIPTEGYGFSKNVYNWYGGAPGFNKAKFTLNPDIGKISLESELIHKNYRELTDTETEEFRGHSNIGYQIVKELPQISDLAQPILQHHEWWDDTGYPQGKSGEEISSTSRVIVVADYYDFLVNSHCNYREKVNKEQALERIGEKSGSQFQPRIAEAFLETV